MDEKVLNIIINHNKALTYDEIKDNLTLEERDDLSNSLERLIKDLKIRITNKGKYEKFNDKSFKVGVFAGNKKGFGFVIVEGSKKDYFVSKENVGGAIDGDTVIIKVLDEGKKEAIVKSVSERNLSKTLVGEFYVKDGKNFIDLDNDKLNIVVEIPKEYSMNAVSGHKVIVRILNKMDNTNYYTGEVIRVIGHKDDPFVDILCVAAKYHINDVFPDGVLEEVKNIPSEVSESELEGRRDLTSQMIFTIDGDDTKDIDDAISISKDGDKYVLGVHIADVSHYVRPNTSLYDEAFERGTSNYLANTVIPMLPHELSNGICSLNPNVVRLTLSCVMEIDEKGNVVSSEIFESYIKSRKQMTYKCVNSILEKGEIPEGYDEYVDDLKLMDELSNIVRKNKIAKGYIDFDVDEPKIITDDDGVAIDIQKRYRGRGENLIEDFMILANESVASTISYMDLPFVYRVHGNPDDDKLKRFLSFISTLGYKINGNMKSITPKTIQNILSQLKGKKEYPILSDMLLRSMQKAVYDTVNIGHFGLASRFYTHFTSPIRRFPDLTVHRLIRTYLFDHKINGETVKYFEGELPLIAKHSSEREKAAVSCERDVDDMKMAEYMESHIGESYKGIISTVTSYGFYVKLSNLVEGMVKIDSLEGYYTFDESTYSLVSKKGKRFRLGDEVLITVIGTDKSKGLIDFIVGDKNGDKKQKSEV